MPRTKVNGVVSPPAGVTDGGASAIASAFDGAARGALQIGARLREAEIKEGKKQAIIDNASVCLLYTSPSPRDQRGSRMPSSA